MRRRNAGVCASCGLLGLITSLFASTSSVQADVMDAMPVFVPRVLRGACKSTEELCPVYPGSDDLRVSQNCYAVSVDPPAWLHNADLDNVSLLSFFCVCMCMATVYGLHAT